jgi:phosphoribosylformylglycinamidine synthase
VKAGVIVFPGSNCDRDVAVVLESVTGTAPAMVWHADSSLPDLDLIVLPGGFSYGDYLRCGAMSAKSPIMREVVKRAEEGAAVLGICNGFQVLTESGLLPGALMRNRGLNFICKDVWLRVEDCASRFTLRYEDEQNILIPIAHHDGNYYADDATLEQLEGEGQVLFRYVDESGEASDAANPNGSRNNIAGIVNADGNVLGMMPHPERMAEAALGGTDGRALFESLLETLG